MASSVCQKVAIGKAPPRPRSSPGSLPFSRVPFRQGSRGPAAGAGCAAGTGRVGQRVVARDGVARDGPLGQNQTMLADIDGYDRLMTLDEIGAGPAPRGRAGR